MATGRHRWVEYADKSAYNASSVPPEWHGWLHYMTDHTPEEVFTFLDHHVIYSSYCVMSLPRVDVVVEGAGGTVQGHHCGSPNTCFFLIIPACRLQLKSLKPDRYGVEHQRNRTGEGEDVIHHPKGSATNRSQRDWKRYEPWQPS